jgi:hypothetical protein
MKINPDVLESSGGIVGYNDEAGVTMVLRELESLKGQWSGVLQVTPSLPQFNPNPSQFNPKL